MEEISGKVDLHGKFLRPNSNLSPLSLKTSLSGKSSPRNSPAYRRLGSSGTPRRNFRGSTGKFVWIRNNRVVFWLMLILIWAYIGFHVQSQWAHGDHKTEFIGYRSLRRSVKTEENAIKGANNTNAPGKARLSVEGKKGLDSNSGINLMKKGRKVRRLRRGPVKVKEVVGENQTRYMDEGMIPRKNTSYGLIVGPFSQTEDSVLGSSSGKKSGNCNRKAEFARLVSSKKFVLVFHELSMTGAPLSMLELGAEILSCDGLVYAIVLSWKGGLMGELKKRGIKVLRHDRGSAEFQVCPRKADHIIEQDRLSALSWIRNNDMLVMSLSSINPGKGQLLLLEAAFLVTEHNVFLEDPKRYELMEEDKLPGVAHQNQSINQTDKPADGLEKSNSTRVNSKKKKKTKQHIKTPTDGEQRQPRNLLSEVAGQQAETLKVLIGSIGSKSNKELYLKEILEFLSLHSNSSKAVLWTPATACVAALYAAADVYVINAQGIGETFGRVTVEAMAFGLPVLGTDAGGTREIVDHKVTGLLHPIGHEGTKTLAQHIQYLLNNPSARKKMGKNGRNKVQEKYLKHHTYESFAKVLFKSMRPR
ncbi:uncharacterized protein A4U43_C01F21740 [Asparagus officinalis]|uniref:Glycosyl transferase family 1 domain-containing protein n=1 Tax=Asparagus officinalis TaxID=4686 RepID=A0A5P1FRD9_ASPOF|nr:uncharacterized protein A4U43_C01F21740 [Asparagus officinalis]